MENKHLWYGLGTMVLGTSLFLGGLGIGKASFSPEQVYSKEKNNQNYIIVSTLNKNRYIFVEQPNGSYKSLDRLQGEQKSQLEEMAKQLK